MNANFIGTVTFVLGLILQIIAAVGCTTVGTTTSCAGSMIPDPWGQYIGIAATFIGLALKFFKPGGTVTEKLTSPSVVVTTEPKVGTVTENQVKAGPMASPAKV